ncbi:MAG: hypothetical protein Q9195_008811 [Heterodermia aff. obscurata]
MKETFEAPTVDAWTLARERYIEDLTDEEKSLFAKGSKATLEATLYEASAAEKSHRASSRGRRLTSRILLPFIDAIDQYSEALDLARQYGEFFDKTVAMLSKIGEVLPRCRDYEKFEGSFRYFKAHPQPRDYSSNSSRLVVVSLMIFAKTSWKPFDQQFAQQLTKFRDHRRSVEKEADIAHMLEEADSRALVRLRMLELEKQKEGASGPHIPTKPVLTLF